MTYRRMSKKQEMFIVSLANELHQEIDWYNCRTLDQANALITKLLKGRQKTQTPKPPQMSLL